ncbi:MAG: acyl carrier protein [Bacillota bacterium]
MTNMEQDVIEIIAKVAKKKPDELDLKTRLAEDLMLKSMSRIELAALIDSKFGTTTTNFEIRMPKTIEEVIQLVESKR